MNREVLFATTEGTALKSGNVRANFMAEASHTKRQIKLGLVVFLDAFARNLPRRTLVDGRANLFTVYLTRITVGGRGWDTDNLGTAFKAYRDSFAAAIWRGHDALAAFSDPTGDAWKRIAGRDDGRKEFTWMPCAQQRSTTLEGIKLRVEDLDDGADMIVHLATPSAMGDSAIDGRPRPVPKSSRPNGGHRNAQIVMQFRKAWMALPWQQDEDPDAPLKNLVEATQLSNLLDVHVSNIRKKLGHEFIATRRGHGYWVGPDL